MKKCFFQTYEAAIFYFFEKLFYYYECKLRHFHKNTCVFIFLWWSRKQPSEEFYKKMFFKILQNFENKTPLLESLFNKIAGLQAWLQKRLQHRRFPLIVAKFLRTSFFKEDLWKAASDEMLIITLIHSKINIWVQQSYDYDSSF